MYYMFNIFTSILILIYFGQKTMETETDENAPPEEKRKSSIIKVESLTQIISSYQRIKVL